VLQVTRVSGIREEEEEEEEEEVPRRVEDWAEGEPQ
jgi:hypothetical protein